MAVTRDADLSRVAVIKVPNRANAVDACISAHHHHMYSYGWSPEAEGLYEFFTLTGMLVMMVGCMEIGCSTSAPKEASSAASSYVMRPTGRASCTNLRFGEYNITVSFSLL